MLNSYEETILMDAAEEAVVSERPSQLQFGHQQRGKYLDFFVRITAPDRVTNEFWMTADALEELLAAILDALQEDDNT